MQPGASLAHLGLQPQLVVEEAADASVEAHSSKPACACACLSLSVQCQACMYMYYICMNAHVCMYEHVDIYMSVCR